MYDIVMGQTLALTVAHVHSLHAQYNLDLQARDIVFVLNTCILMMSICAKNLKNHIMQDKGTDKT